MSSNAAVPAGAAARAKTRIVGITLAAVALMGTGAWAVDRWYAGVLRAEAGIRMESRLAGHASALELALAKRAALLNGLTAWMQERRGAPSEAFRTFAASLHRVDPGVRALQRVAGGRIVDSYPEEGNEGVLGLDVLGHPDPGVASGLRRALESGEITVTGPVDLVQGGVGVILRRSVGGAGDFEATAAALVVDVRTLVDEAGIPTLLGSLEVALETSDGVHVYGRPILEAAEPIRVVVPLPEGRWTLVAAPVGGWSAVVARDLRSERLGLVVFLVLGTLLVYAVVDRDTRLGWAVEIRTAELTEANRRLESAAAELGGREQLLRAALTAGRVATWSWDIRNDEIWRWGSGRSFYMEDAVPPRDTKALMERIHPEDRAAFARALEEARTTGTLDQEYRVDLGGGTYAWMKTAGRSSERDEHGPVRIIGAVVDISHVKDLEAQVLHRGRLDLIGQLAGGVAHDLHNALAVVRAELELALDDEVGFPLRTAATEALDATQYASLLLGQLLTFARKDEVRPTTFEWDQMCAEVGSFLARLLGPAVELELELDAEGAAVHMDRAQAMQILTNLAVNARDAMEGTGSGSGTLTLATRLVPDGSRVAPAAAAECSVVLEVRDTGTGIPPEARGRVFEAFFTTKGADRGTGLGLSTTQRIVRESRGDIVFDTSPAGTTFTVVIPTVR